MKKIRYIACSVGTAAVWLIAAFIFSDQMLILSVTDLLFAGLILFHATLSTVAIWWTPQALLLPTTNCRATDSPTNAFDVSLPPHPMTRPGSAIWWKLAFVSAVLDVATLPIWVLLHFGLIPESYPIPLVVPLCAILAVPVAYLLIFSLWHWRTRYAGGRHIAWPILFVITAWPLFSTLPGSVFTSLAYCVLHLVPDARCRGAYASPAPLTLSPPASPLPQSYQLGKSACFVVGWSLIIGAVLCTVMTCVAHFVIWNVFEDILPNQVGKLFTEEISDSLWLGSQAGKITVVTCLLSTLAAALGAALIQVSQRLRWRMLDEHEKEKLREDI